MQKFFTTTIISKFIKYLLMCTPLPTCSYIEDRDLMVNGRTYIYNGKFYLCTKTGIFSDGTKGYMSKLRCSESIYASSDIIVTDKLVVDGNKRSAEFEEISSYVMGESILGLTEDFVSTSSYYDSDTHRKLGDYLRLLKSMYGLDLMSLYNCFNNYYVDNIDLSSGNLSGHGNSNYRVTLVPIRFNKEYTIAMNSSSNVFMKPVIYKGKLLQHPNGRFIYDDIYPAIYKYGHLSYSSPIEIRVENSDEFSQSLENYLYLAIQIPVGVSTRVTVIEGSAKSYNFPIIYDSSMYSKLCNKDINKIFKSAASLLDSSNTNVMNTTNIPFSDRLVEYLIQHTIDSREQLIYNIERVTDKFNYPRGVLATWEQELRGKLFDKYMKLEEKYDTLQYKDILGYVDKDIESALDRGYLKYKDDNQRI